MKFARLFQPRNPLFWLMVVFNLLSAALAWVLRTWPLSSFGLFLIGTLALANAGMGLWLAWRLVREDPGQGPAG